MLAAEAEPGYPGGYDEDLYAEGGTFRRSVSGLSDAQPASLGTGMGTGVGKSSVGWREKLMSFIDQWLDISNVIRNR